MNEMNTSLSQTPRSHSLSEWVMATRPWSFPASAMPVIVTLAYLTWRGYDINWLTGIWALANIILFHGAGNTWSDYHDFIHGVDTPDTYGVKFLTSGQFRPEEIRRLSLCLLTAALLGGVCLLSLTGPALLWYGLAGILCTLLYPRLKFRALGDAVIAVAYAWLPTWGTSYVAIGKVDMGVLLLAVPVGMITIAILHVNNTRDVHTDGAARISTLAMKIGHRNASLLYQFLILGPFVFIPVCVITGLLPWLTLLTFLALPSALSNARCMRNCQIEDTSVIALLDEATAKLQLVFSLLLCISFFTARIIS